MILENVNILEVISDLSSNAVYSALTESYTSDDEAEAYFKQTYLTTADNGDIHYTEQAQDLYNQYHSYYSQIISQTLGIEL